MTKGTQLHLRRLLGCTILPMLTVSMATRAQVTRAELVESGIDAFFNLEIDRARDFFVAAINPVSQPPDSIWAIGVQYLTQMHIEAGNSDLADTWMRWAVRLKPDMQVDETTFLPEVIRRYRAALDLVGTNAVGDRVSETTWVWPTLGNRATSGILRITSSSLNAPVFVSIAGRESIQSGQDMTLPPGTYSMQVSAEGYNEVDVIREILPGVTSVLSFNLQPIVVAPELEVRPDVLPDSIEAGARSKLARFTVTRFRTDPTCGTAFFAGQDGLLLTTYSAIRGAEALEIELADGSNISENISVAAWDAESNVAVLKLPISSTDSLDLASDVTDGQWAWAFTHPGCRSASVAQLQVASWTDRPSGRLQLTDAIENGDQGGPLIAQSGIVLGLSSGESAAVPADHVASTIDAARRNVREDRLVALRTVAERENHLYGSVMIQSTLSNAIAHVTPLERWQWPETETSGPVPLTYTGPNGRYQLDLQAPGSEPHQAEFTIDPGVFKEITEPQIIAAGGGKKFPWPIALLGAAGAAVGGILALSGGGDQTTPPPPPAEDGWIKIIFPQHP